MEASVAVAFFSPPVRFSTERFVCVLASEGASSAVWSCSTEMSADLCYSRGIRESVRHQKTLLLDSFPPDHPSSFHSSSYRTLDPVRGFPSCTSERVTKKRVHATQDFARVCFFFSILRAQAHVFAEVFGAPGANLVTVLKVPQTHRESCCKV